MRVQSSAVSSFVSLESYVLSLESPEKEPSRRAALSANASASASAVSLPGSPIPTPFLDRGSTVAMSTETPFNLSSFIDSQTIVPFPKPLPSKSSTHPDAAPALELIVKKKVSVL